MYRKDTSLILTWYVEVYAENTRVHVLLYSARHLVIKRMDRKKFWRWTKQAVNNIILVYTEWRDMLDSGSEVCAYKGPYVSRPTQTGAIQLLMKTGDPSGQRTQELEASKEQSDCSYLDQTYDSQKRRAFTKVTKTSRTSSQISVL